MNGVDQKQIRKIKTTTTTKSNANKSCFEVKKHEEKHNF